MRSYLTILLACAISAKATTINVGCNYTEITNALLTTAQEGDIVLIGSGDCIISNAIYVNRDISFTIAGSGTNLTTLRSAAGLERILHIQSSSATNVFTIRDLNIVGDNANAFGVVVSGTGFRAPIHIYNIQMTNVCGRGISLGVNAFGCVDHCIMVAGVWFQQMLDFNGTAEAAWTNAIPFGTTNVQCVEDCYFKTTPAIGGVGNGCFDAYDGAQFVFRHNIHDGSMATGSHGYDSGTCAPRSWEIYNNLFTNQTENLPAIAMRGGSGVVFSNTVVGSANSVVALSYYRICPKDHDYTSGSLTDYGAYYSCLPLGKPGDPYYIYFTGNTNDGGGLYKYFSGNPTEGSHLQVGFTTYYFTTNFANLPYSSGNANGFGGGGVMIGATLAQTITNVYQAINLVPAGLGIAYSNYPGTPYNIGHDFIATALTATNITLINALDNYTNAFGWPAYQQSGTIKSYPLTGTNFHQHAELWPCYAWSNTLNGSLDVFSLGADTCNNTTNILKLNRDYFNAVPSGATYTPLVYPHPLVTANLNYTSIVSTVTANIGTLHIGP